MLDVDYSGSDGGSDSVLYRSSIGTYRILDDEAHYLAHLVTNTNPSGPGSLTQAILDANATTWRDTIAFNIPGTGVQTINLTSTLPSISDSVIIEGRTQPGYAGTPLIELNGTGAGPGANGLTITAANSTVRGLIINRFADKGVLITGAGATGNVIQGNYIGTDATGTVDFGNTYDGVVIVNASGNTIGGTSASDRNVISGNNRAGVYIGWTAGATGNVVQGNYIGTKANGTEGLGNGQHGVFVELASGNTVRGNVISANGDKGVFITGASAKLNKVQGNKIGTDKGGLIDLGNTYDGVMVFNASDNTIGGTTDADRDIISGNNRFGLYVGGPGATGNMVQGNFIGTDVSGAADLWNGLTWMDSTGTNTFQNNTSRGPVPNAADRVAPATASDWIGTLERAGSSANWDEFLAGGVSNPTYRVGTGNLSDVRQWIGHSECSSCSPGTAHTQRLQFDGLEPGAVYEVNVYPGYVSTTAAFNAGLVAGAGTIQQGASISFPQDGYYPSPNVWQIRFVPDTTSVTLQLGNGLLSGWQYMLFDAIETKGPRHFLGTQESSPSSAKWDEFKGAADTETYVVGQSDLTSVRPWIGHSECSGCGAAKKQRLKFDNLEIGTTYAVDVYPGYVSQSSYYSASIVEGNGVIRSGKDMLMTGEYTFSPNPGVWRILFTPSTSSLSLELGHSLTSGTYYMYFDAIEWVGEVYTIGTRDATWQSTGSNEFKGTSDTETYVVGQSGLDEMRLWIGHSACGSCGAGVSKYQRLKFDNLQIGRPYEVNVYAGYSQTTERFSASIVDGQGTIQTGASMAYTLGYIPQPEVWRISFVPDSTSVTLQLGNGRTDGYHYLYLDAITIQSTADLPPGHPALVAASAAKPGKTGGDTLSLEKLGEVVDAAIARWDAAGLDRSAVAMLDRVAVQVTPLPGQTLAWVVTGDGQTPTIWVDDDAAGHGWFVDATPADDREFRASHSDDERRARRKSPAAGRVDLLTVLMHEFGHVLGLDHTHDEDHGSDVMAESLPLGTRRLPEESEPHAEQVDRVLDHLSDAPDLVRGGPAERCGLDERCEKRFLKSLRHDKSAKAAMRGLRHRHAAADNGDAADVEAADKALDAILAERLSGHGPRGGNRRLLVLLDDSTTYLVDSALAALD